MSYITKYALTEGIIQSEIKPTFSKLHYRVGNDVVGVSDIYATKESAIAKAESMRAKKIANLQWQIAKLEALKFEI
jgi:hypothetical protein